MNSTASQSSSSGCDGGSLCVPKSSLVATRPVPKYACQTRLTIARAVVGDFAVDQPLRERQAGSAARPAAAGAGTPARPASPASAGLRKSPRFSTCVSRGSLALGKHQLRRAFRDAAPQRLDRLVRVLPLGHGRPPVAEDGLHLLRACAVRAGWPGSARTLAGSGSAAASGVGR